MKTTLLALFAMATLGACGGGSGTKTDAATLADMAKPTGDAAMPPAPDMATLQGCGVTDYLDHTGDSGSVAVTPWDTSSSTPRCIKIKTGQTVTWASSSTHPLIAQGAGTTPSPIPSTAATTPQSITFPNVGNYGFWCQVHTTIMEGAILVVSP